MGKSMRTVIGLLIVLSPIIFLMWQSGLGLWSGIKVMIGFVVILAIVMVGILIMESQR